MVSLELREGISETIDILNHMEKEYLDKIPEKFKEFLENNKSDSYISNLDHSKKLNEMELKEKTKDILAVIYMNYWCTPEQKKDYMNILKENEKVYQEGLREKYSPDNIFKKRSEEKQVEESFENEVSMIEYEESLIKKIINKIKNIFRK